jgi:hypothetical protein
MSLTACGVASSGSASGQHLPTIPAPQSSVPSHGRTVSAAALTRAADVSSAATGYRAQYTTDEQIPGTVQTLHMSGIGSFTPSTHTGEISMDMTVPGIASRVGIEAVLDGTTIYMKLPALIAGKVPGGKPWWRMDLTELSQKEGLPGLGSLFSSSNSSLDPGQYLSYLRAAAGTVENLGRASVDGVQTVHYHAQIDPARLAGAVPAAARASIAKLEHDLSGPMPADVWVDSSNRVRRIVFGESITIPAGAGTLTLRTQVDFVSYGSQPAPTLPPADQTVDLASLIH